MVTISGVVRVKVQVGSDTVVLVCRRPTAPEQSAFLGARFKTKGRKVKSELYEAREAFIDKILIDAEGAEFASGTGVRPLNASTDLSAEDRQQWTRIMGKPVDRWQDLIPVSWKSSAAMTFEDPAQDEGEGDDSSGN